MNHCRDCNSDYTTPGTCNCFAPGGKRYAQSATVYPVYVPPYYPWTTQPWVKPWITVWGSGTTASPATTGITFSGGSISGSTVTIPDTTAYSCNVAGCVSCGQAGGNC